MNGDVHAQDAQRSGKGGKIKPLLIILPAIVIIALIVVIVLLLVTRREPEQVTVEPQKRNVVVTEDNVEEVVEEMALAEMVEPGYYEVSMSTEWHFANGSAVSEDAYVANVENNTNDVFFDLVLAEDGEPVIYQSPVIPRGAYLEGIALDVPLGAGTYDCVIIYHLIDADQNTLSTLRVTATVIVES